MAHNMFSIPSILRCDQPWKTYWKMCFQSIAFLSPVFRFNQTDAKINSRRGEIFHAKTNYMVNHALFDSFFYQLINPKIGNTDQYCTCRRKINLHGWGHLGFYCFFSFFSHKIIGFICSVVHRISAN